MMSPGKSVLLLASALCLMLLMGPVEAQQGQKDLFEDQEIGFPIPDPRIPVQPPGSSQDPRTNPTAGVASPRVLPVVMNDRGLADSVISGAAGVAFPTSSVNLPTCGDPSAINFGQMGLCVFGPPPPPPPTCGTPQPPQDNRIVACPAPQTGQIFERRGYNPAPAPTCWSPGVWTQIGNTCSTPSTCGARPADETRSTSCPGGQAGLIYESRSFNAAAEPACWVAGAWMEVLRTCSVTCVGVPQPPSESRTTGCPAPQTGTISELRTYAAAPAPACWAPGAWTQITSTCAAPCPVRPPDETRTVACPTGFVGAGILQTRTFNADAPPVCWAPGPWLQTSFNCLPETAPPAPGFCPTAGGAGSWGQGCQTFAGGGPSDDTACSSIAPGPAGTNVPYPICFSGTHRASYPPLSTVGSSGCIWRCN